MDENNIEEASPTNHTPLNKIDDRGNRFTNESLDTIHRFWTNQILLPTLQNIVLLFYVGIGIAIVLLLYLPWHTFRAIIHEEEHPDEVAFTSAAVFVIITLILSTSLIYSHLSHWYMPDVQKYVFLLFFWIPGRKKISFFLCVYSQTKYIHIVHFIDMLYESFLWFLFILYNHGYHYDFSPLVFILIHYEICMRYKCLCDFFYYYYYYDFFYMFAYRILWFTLISSLWFLFKALVIQSFLYYLIELLGGEECLIQVLQRKDAKYGNHEFIFQYFFPNWTMGMEFARQCKHGVLQYVVVKACTTLATATLQPLHLYGEGQFFNPLVGYPYISFCLNLSQMWALYCLIKFYHATHEELSHPIHWHPLRKFLCIKGVIFFTWWQGIGITYLKSRDIIDTIGNWDKNQVANGIQNYLICAEMFMFAIAHMISFSHLECIPSSYEMRMRDRRIRQESKENNSERVSWWPRWRDSSKAAKDHDDQGELTQSLLEPEMNRTDQNQIGHDDLPPLKIKTLEKPGQLYDAFWISTVPRDTLKEVKRFRHDVLSSRKSENSFKS